MKTPRERRASRTQPYTIGKPNIYGQPYTTSSSQTEKSDSRPRETENSESRPAETESIIPPESENDISHNSQAISTLAHDHSAESCIDCFLLFHAVFEIFFRPDPTSSKYFLQLSKTIFSAAKKIVKECPANSETVDIDDIINIADPNNGC